MTQTMIERVAQAICATDCDFPYVPFDWPSDDVRENYMRLAHAAFEAMKYVDGVDEGRLIDVSNAHRVEAVTLALAWDAMIDAALQEDQPMPSDTTNFDRIMEGLQEVVEIEAGRAAPARVLAPRDGKMVEAPYEIMAHMTHCNKGEYEGGCKYGEDETCPALQEKPYV